MIGTASTWAGPFLSPLLPLYDPFPNFLHLANPNRLGPLQFTAVQSFTHTAQLPHGRVQPCPPALLSGRVGGWETRSNVKGTLSAPVLKGQSGDTTIIPSMARAAGALTMGYRFVCPASPFFPNFTTPPRNPTFLAEGYSFCALQRETSWREWFSRETTAYGENAPSTSYTQQYILQLSTKQQLLQLLPAQLTPRLIPISEG